MSPSKKTAAGKGPAKVLDKIVLAIRAQETGKASRQAIAKHLLKNYEYSNPTALKKALKKGVDNGVLKQSGQSFTVVGDPMKEAKAEETVQIKTIVTGKEDSSAVAERGDTVTVSYIGKLQNNGYEFDRATSFKFQLGAGDVIKGWDMGVEGMKKGGRRELTVPSKLGYGKRGCAPDIPGGATLHFVITLKKIQRT